MTRIATINLQPRELSESVLAASRQVWLAGLGAAAITREWVQKEAGQAMKSLVREGAAAESRAIRFVGDRIEASMTRANDVWAQTRRTVESVKNVAENTIALAQQALPKGLPQFVMPGVAIKVTKPATKRAKPAAPTRKARGAKKVKRAVRRG